MTDPRVGETFLLDLDGTAIAGRYIEVDPPHRMLLKWDRQGTDTATPTPTFIEITLTPMGDGTDVKVQFSGLSGEDAAFYRQLWAHRLDRIAAAFCPWPWNSTWPLTPSLAPNLAHFLATLRRHAATPGQLHATGRPRSR